MCTCERVAAPTGASRSGGVTKMILAALRRVTTVAALSFALCSGAAMPGGAEAAQRKGAGGRLTAVFVHGGGWVSGTPSMGDPMVGFYKKRRVPFNAIDYPKIPVVKLADMVADVKRQLNDVHRINPLIVVGHSAGAHLAAAATFSPGAPITRCLILLDGIGYDLVSLIATGPGFQSRLNLTPAEAAKLSPLALMAKSKNRPAVLLAAGNDSRGTALQATAFATALGLKGYDVKLAVFPTMSHDAFLADFANPASALSLETAAFLAAHPRCSRKPK